mgnify:CR=1 FL=1
MQRMIDPFAGAPRDANGSIVYTVEDKELDQLLMYGDEEKLRVQYEALKAKNEAWDMDEEEEESFRMAMLQELEENKTIFKADDFEKILTKELGVFSEGEKYSYVKDLKDAYRNSLKTTSEEKILSTIPDHVFWDIKKPLQKKAIMPKNRYNTFRGREYDNFFEMRDSEEYLDRMKKKDNRNDSISIYRRY